MNQTPAACRSIPEKRLGPGGRLVLVTAALGLCFSAPLCRLVQFAVTAEFHSYILLVPFVSLYLVWLTRESFTRPSATVRGWAWLPLLGGAAALAAYWHAGQSRAPWPEVDVLALSTLAFVLFLLGACCLVVGKETMQAIAFPVGFLIFLVPLPTFLREGIVSFLQHTSAAAAYRLFVWSGMAVFRHGMVLQLPGISLEVAPECSGIQSSLVLFLTSLLAGYLFLRTPWKRAVLTLAVLPLGILRNAIRIFTIGQLCVHISPEMIHSAIHVRGGPVFFALSLVPFFLLLVVLHKSDRVTGKNTSKPTGV